MKAGFVQFMASKVNTPNSEHQSVAIVYNCITCFPEVVRFLILSLDGGNKCSGRVLKLDVTTLNNMSKSEKRSLFPTSALKTKNSGDIGIEMKLKTIRETYLFQ